jgi:hypothetical protein
VGECVDAGESVGLRVGGRAVALIGRAVQDGLFDGLNVLGAHEMKFSGVGDAVGSLVGFEGF